MTHILALSGSLRRGSSNTRLLEAAARLAPAGVTVELHDGIGDLPHFNPDLDPERLPAVMALEQAVAGAGGLLISCPEYARGIPGSFKNALDWLVGGSGMPGKPVALLNTSPRASDAQAALRLVLETMSARIVEEAFLTVPLLARDMAAETIALDPVFAEPLRAALDRFVLAIRAA